MISTVDLLELTNSDRLLFIENMINLLYETSHLNEEVNCTEPSSSVRVPCRQVQSPTFPNEEIETVGSEKGQVQNSLSLDDADSVYRITQISKTCKCKTINQVSPWQLLVKMHL